MFSNNVQTLSFKGNALEDQIMQELKSEKITKIPFYLYKVILFPLKKFNEFHESSSIAKYLIPLTEDQ